MRKVIKTSWLVMIQFEEGEDHRSLPALLGKPKPPFLEKL